MNIEINVIELQQLLTSIHLSSSHVDSAARFYIKHGLDQLTQQSLCEEWYNHFHFARGNQDGDKVIKALLHMAQRVLENSNKNESTYLNMREAFKKQIQKALNQIKEGQFPMELSKYIRDLLKQWDEKQLFSRQDIQLMMEIVEPQKISDLNKSQFPPPSYLLNYAKNHKELQIRINKQNDLIAKLEEIIATGGTEQQYDQILEHYSKSIESVQKYRQLVIKDIIDELKELDKTHYKSVIDLKYIVQRLDELNNLKEKKANDYFTV